ncbi:MAG: helix-turn-helix transcriptional regulator [Acetobacteraceae bacterium]|nr:helix-turn-helix transcriptional regulator [Acetobacteraceae bacterium]MBV8589630.1 helix-turn-helix transcriptional regulator [Acetobacteraceae bacterium]
MRPNTADSRKPGETEQEQGRRPNPVDVHLGSRIRIRRKLLGLSQERLAELLGLTFQQVQKYERGLNRGGASRLFDLTRVLYIPISFFFDDIPGNLTRTQGGSRPAVLVESEECSRDDRLRLIRGETLDLVRAYYRIRDPSVRKRVFELIKSMGPPEFSSNQTAGSGPAASGEPHGSRAI